MEDQDGVTITLREVYDTVTKTHEAVLLMSPQVAKVEQTANDALKIANEANQRSLQTQRQLSWVWKVLGAVGSGAAVSFVTAEVAKLVH